MSRKVSRRPGRETAKQQRRERKRAGQQLRQQQRAQGLEPVERPALIGIETERTDTLGRE